MNSVVQVMEDESINEADQEKDDKEESAKLQVRNQIVHGGLFSESC